MIAERKTTRVRSKKQSDTLACGTAKSDIGWIAAAWRGERLAGVTIGHLTPQDALASLSIASEHKFTSDLTQAQQCLLDRLCRHAAGQREEFDDVSIDSAHLAPFTRKVVQRCREIPPGETMTYAELAAACGSPKAARAVGNVMASNRFPLVVPCHRVVGSGGGLGGFSAPQGVVLKKQLLQSEGVKI